MAIGGLINQTVKRDISLNLNISWEWENQDKGTVKWTFSNTGNSIGSGILFRATYPFGNAFWPIYEENPAFDTKFTTMAIPLVDQGTENNSPPLAVIKTPSGSLFVAFVFTLDAGQTWSMIEGGFSSELTPDYNGKPFVIPATRVDVNTFLIHWNEEQCAGYNQQARTNLPCPTNPLNITAAVLSINENIMPLFNDTIMTSQEANSSCVQLILDGLEYDNVSEAIAGVECAFGELSKAIKDKLLVNEEKRSNQ